MPNLQTHYHFKLDFQKYTESKWLTHGTKHRKDNQLQSPEHPCRIDYEGNMFDPIFKRKVQGRKHPGGEQLQNQNYLVTWWNRTQPRNTQKEYLVTWYLP